MSLILEAFPCLRELSLILDIRPDDTMESDAEALKDLQGAVTMLASNPPTAALRRLRFICNSLMSVRARKAVRGEKSASTIAELEAILLGEPYSNAKKFNVSFEVSEPVKRNETRHVEEAIRTAFPALQEKGILHIRFVHACKRLLKLLFISG